MRDSASGLPLSIRILISAIPVVVTGWLFLRYTAFFGTYTVDQTFASTSQIVSDWYPRGRSQDPEKDVKLGKFSQRIVGDPVYMDVTVPQAFESVDVTATVENANQPLLQFGVVAAKQPQAVSLQPFENAAIDSALATWNRIDGENGLTLLQRNPQFTSVDDFLATPPPNEHIGTYQYTLAHTFTDQNYTLRTEPLQIDVALQGSHTFLTYVKNETLHVEFVLRDINAEAGADSVKVGVYNGDKLIDEQKLADDGVTDASTAVSDARAITVDIPGLAEGVYRIVVSGTNDTVIQHIAARQRYFVAQNHLRLLDVSQYSGQFPPSTTPVAVSFNGNKLIARADDIAGVQTISINADVLRIENVDTPYTWIRSSNIADPYRTVTIPHGGAVLDAKGVFAFSQDSFFNPSGNIESMDEATQLNDLDDILYRNYTAPDTATDSALKTQHVHINLAGVQGDRKHLAFVLSAPGIDRNHYTVTVHSLHFVFHRQSFFTRLKGFLFDHTHTLYE